MRTSSGLLAAILLLGLSATTSRAATLELTEATLSVGIGALPPITTPAVTLAPALVSSGGGSFSMPAGLFSAFVPLATPLFTGVPLISSLNVTVANASGSFTALGGFGGGFGGPQPLSGVARIGVLGLFTVPVPLGNVGGGGSIALFVAQISVTVIGQIFTTGPAVVTGVASTLTHLAGTTICAPATCGLGTTTAVSPTFTVGGFTLGGGKLFANTLTLTGYDNRTAGHQGSILLVSPLQLFTNVAGVLPGFVSNRFDFAVPEPGSLLLLGSSVAGLLLLARRKLRK